MKIISIAAAGVALALIAATLVPGAGEYRGAFAVGALIGSAVALLTIVSGWRERAASPVAGPAAERPRVGIPPAEGPSLTSPAVKPAAPVIPRPTTIASAEADVVALLATLQDKGRLVDFLQDDITGYTDAQVGAAARVVHQGCKAVLDDYFRIVPVRPEHEGATVTVPTGYPADEYRLVGKIGGSAPFSGTLMHRGWKAETVKLPRVVRSGDDGLPTIAPAEVELR